MRFHVVSLPHTQTTKAFSSCAYTEKVRKFCNMMKQRGHTVFLYAGEQNEAECDELIPCITEVERVEAVGEQFYVNAGFDQTQKHWRIFNTNATVNIMRRQQPKDFLCLISGICHKPITDALPEMLAVEFGVGYSGTAQKFRVFESYAWMHAVYGKQSVEPMHFTPPMYDAVIPNYFETADFPFAAGQQDDYYMFLGRLDGNKGLRIAEQACRAEGVELIIAGSGDPSIITYGRYKGVIGPVERGLLLSRAKAVLAPTEYLEPFGGVAIEAMMCGTPVITTDWGGFTETVQHGVTGYRCRMLREFRAAIRNVQLLDRSAIRNYAVSRFSTDVVAAQYEQYFERLSTLWGPGWTAE